MVKQKRQTIAEKVRKGAEIWEKIRLAHPTQPPDQPQPPTHQGDQPTNPGEFAQPFPVPRRDGWGLCGAEFGGLGR